MKEKNSQIREIILHVGLQKTGTSSIQSTLYDEENNKFLLKEGILYPRCWTKNHGNALCSAFHTNPERFRTNKFPKVLSKEEIEEKDRMYLKKFEETLNCSTANKLIISGEDFSWFPADNLEKIKRYLLDIGLNQARFKIMLYTRNPVSFAASKLQQRLRSDGKYSNTLDKLKNKELPTLFQDRIEKFINLFGKESVYVYSFEEARMHDMGLIGHFLQELGVDKNAISNIKEINTNQSSSMFTNEFLAYANDRVPIFVNGRNNEKRSRKDNGPLFRIRGDKFDLPLKDKEEIASKTEQDRRWLKLNYGIEYLVEGIKEEEKYRNINLSFNDIEKIYPSLTQTLQGLLLDFMENEFIFKIPDQHKNQCLELIDKLKTLEEI